jgi:hypothetical protein
MGRMWVGLVDTEELVRKLAGIEQMVSTSMKEGVCAYTRTCEREKERDG